MSQNWWSAQQTQGWVQGGQWTGQPRPQQAGYYGNQHQLQQFQSFGQAPSGQQFPQRPPPPQPQTQFLTQQAYAQEHERRVREEQRKKELEEQKKRLQSLSVAKPSINLDDLFEKQMLEKPQPRPMPPQAPPPEREEPPQKQSAKARSWTGEDFSGIFSQHQTETAAAGEREADNFGDFQSSGQQPGNFPAFPATSLPPQFPNNVQHSLPGGHVMQPWSHMTQGGSHMISTSSYQEPLTSTNVLQGVQGSQPPGSPRTLPPNSAQFPQNLPPHSFSPQIPSHNSMAGNPGNHLQGSNIGPPLLRDSGSPAPTVPPGGVDTSPFHPLYHKVYRLCCRPGEELVSTELLYPVLLSSKLHRAQLRDLWARANRGRPGQLSQMELFVLLGLVGLAQAGREDPSLEDLKKAPSVPVPTLPGLSALSPSSPLQPAAPESDFGQFHSSITPPPSVQLSSGLTPPLSFTSGSEPPLTASSFSPSPSLVEPPSAPSPSSLHVPPANRTGEKQPQNEDDFGDFAQFSVAAPAPTSLAPPLFPATQPPLEVPPSGGWAEFGQFFSFPQAAQPPSNGVLLPQLVANEQELLTNQTQESILPQKTADPSPSKSRQFEFQSSSSQAPTIDGMEKDLLSKLTPTLPRKAPVVADAVEKKEEKIEKPAKPRKSGKVVEEEEGWRVCLAKCAEVLGMCVEVMGKVEERELLQEIAKAQEAHSKLHSIVEVYRFAKRIYATLSTRHPQTAASAGEEVRRIWTELNSLLASDTMEELYRSTCPPPPTLEPDVLSDTISHCAICLMGKSVSISSSLSLDSRPEDYGLALLFHGGQSYHAPCANFWRHLVSEDVPVLG